MKISIQIPTYNQHQFIIKAVDSVLGQKFTNKQIVVADDCSTNYQIKELFEKQKYPEEVKLVINESNLGRVANYRNTLFKELNGDYFMNLDGDDSYLDLEFITPAANYISALSSEFTIASFEFGHNLSLIKKHINWFKEIDNETILVSGKDYIKILKYYQNFMHANCLFHTQLAKKVDFYNIDLLSADFFSSIKIWTQGHIILSSRKIFSWNLHEENASHSYNVDSIVKEEMGIEDFKRWAVLLYSKTELDSIVKHLKYDLYRKVGKSYQNKQKSKDYYWYMINKFRFNKFYIKFLISLLLKV